MDSHKLRQVVGPRCESAYAGSYTGSLLEGPSIPAGVSSTSNVPRLLPVKFSNSLGYIGNSGSFANLLMSHWISQRNSERGLSTDLHCQDIYPTNML